VNAEGDLFVSTAIAVGGQTIGTIDEITPAGSISTFASLSAHFLAFDSSGELYATSGDTIDVITPAGSVTPFTTGLTNPWGIAIEAVPEPSCVALLATSFLPLLARRRR
jgi:hypothetical protein